MLKKKKSFDKCEVPWQEDKLDRCSVTNPEDFIEELELSGQTLESFKDKMGLNWATYKKYLLCYLIYDNFLEKLKQENTILVSKVNSVVDNLEKSKMKKRMDFIDSVVKLDFELSRNNTRYKNSFASTVYMALERASFLSVQGFSY